MKLRISRATCVPILLVSMLLVFSFSKAATAASAPAAATTSATAAKPIVLKFNDYANSRALTKHFEWMTKELETRSGGRVKIEYYWSEALGKGAEQLDGIKGGVFDIATIWPAYAPAKTPLWSVYMLPFVSGSTGAVMKAQNEMAKMPAMAAELDKWNARYLLPMTSMSYEFLTKRPLTSLADLKGMSIRAIGGQEVVIAALGGAAVSIAVPELYQALERGAVNGMLIPVSSMSDYKFYEVAKNVSNIGGGCSLGMYVINKDTWAKLPADIQALFDQVAAEAIAWHTNYYKTALADYEKKLKAANVTFFNMSQTDKEKATAAARPLFDQWVTKNSAGGAPAKQVIDTYISLAKKYAD